MQAFRRARQRRIEQSHRSAQAVIDQLVAETGSESIAVRREEICVGDKIGNGAFGIVSLCSLAGRADLAAKCVNTATLCPADKQLMKNEIKLWSQLSHPNCLRLVNVAFTPTECWLVSELCENGTLRSLHSRRYQARDRMMTGPEMRLKLGQVAAAIAHMHSKNFMHRDVKSENILVSSTGDLKLADYGLAKFA